MPRKSMAQRLAEKKAEMAREREELAQLERAAREEERHHARQLAARVGRLVVGAMGEDRRLRARVEELARGNPAAGDRKLFAGLIDLPEPAAKPREAEGPAGEPSEAPAHLQAAE